MTLEQKLLATERISIIHILGIMKSGARQRLIGMDVEIKTDLLLPCLCGYKPDHYKIAYGRKPYFIWCPVCQKQNWKSLGDLPINIINKWNNNVRIKTVEELKIQSEADYQKKLAEYRQDIKNGEDVNSRYYKNPIYNYKYD